MDNLVIRQAALDDVSALVALDTYAAEDMTRARSIANWVAAGQCLCAERDGRPLGYAVLHHHFFGQPMLELVTVAPAQRRTGIGQALIEHVLDTSTGSRLWTSTNRSNLAMQNLLEKLGFQRSGIVEGLDEGDPELIYRLCR